MAMTTAMVSNDKIIFVNIARKTKRKRKQNGNNTIFS